MSIMSVISVAGRSVYQLHESGDGTVQLEASKGYKGDVTKLLGEDLNSGRAIQISEGSQDEDLGSGDWEDFDLGSIW